MHKRANQKWVPPKVGSPRDWAGRQTNKKKQMCVNKEPEARTARASQDSRPLPCGLRGAPAGALGAHRVGKLQLVLHEGVVEPVARGHGLVVEAHREERPLVPEEVVPPQRQRAAREVPAEHLEQRLRLQRAVVRHLSAERVDGAHRPLLGPDASGIQYFGVISLFSSSKCKEDQYSFFPWISTISCSFSNKKLESLKKS